MTGAAQKSGPTPGYRLFCRERSPDEAIAAKLMATSEPIIIKAYGNNRRLYSPDTASYVSLNDLAAMVADERRFVVREAATGEDITLSILKKITLRRGHG